MQQNIPKEAKGWQVSKNGFRVIYRTYEDILTLEDITKKKKNEKK